MLVGVGNNTELTYMRFAACLADFCHFSGNEATEQTGRTNNLCCLLLPAWRRCVRCLFVTGQHFGGSSHVIAYTHAAHRTTTAGPAAALTALNLLGVYVISSEHLMSMGMSGGGYS